MPNHYLIRAIAPSLLLYDGSEGRTMKRYFCLLLVIACVLHAPVSFLGRPVLAFLSASAVNAWHWFPLFALMILAALQTR